MGTKASADTWRAISLAPIILSDAESTLVFNVSLLFGLTVC